jgi:hypothetical protein
MNGDATASLTTSLEQRDAEVSGLTTQMERLGSLSKPDWFNDD